MNKNPEKAGVLVERGDVEELFHPGKDIKECSDGAVTQGELVFLHLDPGTIRLYGAFEQLHHCLARHRHGVHQVPGWTRCVVLFNASIDVFSDVDLEAVAKQSKRLQVFFLLADHPVVAGGRWHEQSQLLRQPELAALARR